MKKVLILAFVASLSFCFAEGKTEVTDQDIKMMEDMGVFDEIDNGKTVEQGQKMPMQPRTGMNAEQPKMGMNAEQPKMGMNAEQPRMGMNSEQPRMGMNAEQSKENMEIAMLSKIKNELELSPEQAGKFTESFYKTQELMQEYAKNKMGALKELKTALQAEKVDEGVLNGLIENCLKLDRELAEKQKETREKSMVMLDVKQKAKLLMVEGYMQAMFNPNIKRAVRNELKQGEKPNK